MIVSSKCIGLCSVSHIPNLLRYQILKKWLRMSARKGSHVALFMPSLSGGGAERMMVNLANAFVSRGVKTDLVLVKNVGPYQGEVTSGVNIVNLDASRIIASLPGLVRYLRSSRPKALLSTLDTTNVLASWACKWIDVPPKLVLRQDTTISIKGKRLSDPKVKIEPILARWFYPWSDKIIAISSECKEDLVKKVGLSDNKIRVIYNPVVTEDLKEKSEYSVDHEWFETSDVPVILGVGRLEVQKDFKTLIRSFYKLLDSYRARLVILGEGSERAELEELAYSLGISDCVQLPGFVDNPFKYMARADVFVLSSAWEGLGNVLIEAMATGCPVVSTDCRSGPREILADGQYGPLVPVGNEQKLADAIARRINQPRCSEELRERAEEFTVSNAAVQYLEVLLD